VMEGKGCKLGLERGHLGDLGADGGKELKRISRNKMVHVTDSSDSG